MSDHFTTLQSKGLNSRILEYEESSDRDKYEHTKTGNYFFIELDRYKSKYGNRQEIFCAMLFAFKIMLLS